MKNEELFRKGESWKLGHIKSVCVCRGICASLEEKSGQESARERNWNMTKLENWPWSGEGSFVFE